MQRSLGIAASFFGASAVALGAFGAHALRGQLDDAALQIWRTAVDYQFWHALALLALALLPSVVSSSVPPSSPGTAPSRPCAWRLAAIAFTAGIVLFCGSLYALALGAPRWIGAITPCGGLALLIGWVALGFAWCSATKK